MTRQITCSTCGINMGEDYEYLQSLTFDKFKVFKCQECIIKETMAKIKEDYPTFINVCKTMRSMPDAKK